MHAKRHLKAPSGNHFKAARDDGECCRAYVVRVQAVHFELAPHYVLVSKTKSNFPCARTYVDRQEVPTPITPEAWETILNAMLGNSAGPSVPLPAAASSTQARRQVLAIVRSCFVLHWQCQPSNEAMPVRFRNRAVWVIRPRRF